MELSTAEQVQDIEVTGTLNALFEVADHQPLNAALIELRSTQRVKYEFRGRTEANDRSFIFQIFSDLEDGTYEIPSTYYQYAAFYFANHAGWTYASPNQSILHLTISENKTRFSGVIKADFDPVEHKTGASTLYVTASLGVKLSKALF
ncbi:MULTISPECIES: hypothetical protein [Pseudomonas]|jgi:hypothetical protein|uniref:hypothetical protein n=1 Tax=Pseudomonas TaxID=286 RepID=UPI0020931DBE|nr:MULTISPECIES: hypothetical protein [Pseudomonas]UST93689.1 hypothetical protein NF679_16980 [Pseudomonas siliginis]WLG60645.1 hypothetical protein PSH90_17340 [Pseudomonas sp. FP1762]